MDAICFCILIDYVFLYRFRPALVKECIHAVLMEHLYNKEYQQETASEDTKLLVDIIKNKIKGTVTFFSVFY